MHKHRKVQITTPKSFCFVLIPNFPPPFLPEPKTQLFSTSAYPLPPVPDHYIHKFANAGPPLIQLWASSGKNTTRKIHRNTHCKHVDSIWPSNVARRSLGSFSPSPHPLTPQGTIPTSTNLPEMGKSVASSGTKTMETPLRHPARQSR